jgi:hypothetical protein
MLSILLRIIDVMSWNEPNWLGFKHVPEGEV